MGLVNPVQSNAGDTIEASDINNPINQLAAVINGGIDATNITDGSISAAKLTNASVTPNKLALSPVGVFVLANESTTSGAYTDLATVTDTVTVTIGSNGLALVFIGANITNITTGVSNVVSVALTGTNTVAAGAGQTPVITFASSSTSTSTVTPCTTFRLMTGLTPGATTFKMKYLAGGSSSGFFSSRTLAVIPL